MSEEITATMTYDVQSMMPAHYWHQYKHNRRTKFIGVIAMTMLALLFLLPKQPGSFTFKPSIILAPVGLLMLVGLIRWVGKWAFSRSIKSSPSNGKPIRYTIDDSGVKVALPDGSAEFAWSYFMQSTVTPDGVLLYAQKLAFNWLPKAAFTSEADYNRFLDLIVAKTKHSKLS